MKAEQGAVKFISQYNRIKNVRPSKREVKNVLGYTVTTIFTTGVLGHGKSTVTKDGEHVPKDGKPYATFYGVSKKDAFEKAKAWVEEEIERLKNPYPQEEMAFA